MVSTTRDKGVFLLTPGNHRNRPEPEPLRGQGSILVVEDDAPTLRLERVLLEEQGYSVEVVSSGEEAVEALMTRKPALVLLDIGLPGMDGFATCQRIREISRVPIIMVTGRDCLDDKVKGMNVGADDYVTKPFLTHELATRVQVILRRTAAEYGAAQYFGNAGPGPSPTRFTESQMDHSKVVDTRSIAPEPGFSPQTSPPAVQLQPAPGAGAPALASQLAGAEQVSDPLAPSAGPAAESGPVVDAPPQATAGDTAYEGTVRLIVTTLGPVSNLISFVSELRQNPHYRLLRLVANQHREGMDIWLGLREPVPLLSCLMEVKGVAEVTTNCERASESDEPSLNVLLK